MIRKRDFMNYLGIDAFGKPSPGEKTQNYTDKLEKKYLLNNQKSTDKLRKRLSMSAMLHLVL